MIIVKKDTLDVFDASLLGTMPEYRHLQLDFTDTDGFLEEALDSAELAIVQMPDHPVIDYRYQKVECGEVTESDGVYSADWVLSIVDLPLAALAEMIASDLAAACENEITAGFYSSALGSSHFYSCDMAAQLNIQANCLAASVGRDVRHVCTDSDGVRAIRAHTKEQMIAVGDSMGEHIWSCLDKIDALRGSIASAVANNDASALIEIKW